MPEGDARRPGGPVDTVLAYLAALGRADVDAAVALVAPGFVNEHTARLAEGSIGRDAYRARLPGFLAAFPGLAYDVEDVVAEDDRVVVAYVMTASARREDGAGTVPLRVRGVFRFEVVDGRIGRRVDYWDSLVVTEQLSPPG